MKDWFEIFKTGKHTSANGVTKDFTVDDCQKIVDNYNSNITNHEAPIVIGHPKDNDPAYGWIEELKLVGEKILAKPKQVVKEFAEAVEQGLFKKRSVSLYPDLTLRHVGFLGAVPPAIKGLADIKFNDEKEAEQYDFSEAEVNAGEPDVSKLQEQIANLQNQINSFSETSAKLNEYQQSIDKLKTDLEFADTSRVQAEENLQKLNVQIRKLEFQQYLNEKLAYGSLTPVQSGKVELLLEALDSIELKETEDKTRVFEFSDGNKFHPVTLFKEFIDLLPKQIPGEVQNYASRNNQTDPEVEEELARANRIAASVNN